MTRHNAKRPLTFVKDLDGYLRAGLEQHAREARRAVVLGELAALLRDPNVDARLTAFAEAIGLPRAALERAIALELVEARSREADARAAVMEGQR